MLSRGNKDIPYGFDVVFPEDSTQEEVYEGTARPIIDAVLSGFNASVFAYGATGAGKTHTMIGNDGAPGVMVQALRDLFERMRGTALDSSYKVALTYLEIYNEQVKDLLAPAGKKPLEIREDARGCQVVGLSEHYPADEAGVFALLDQGNRGRTQSATAANATSSRSHAVCQITVQSKARTVAITESVSTGKLSLVDLAGSERATKNMGERFVEGANINKSLLALGNVINALCALKPGKEDHIPYRDSKLTRLLKDSLGGNCKTVMIANVSPSSASFEDTHNTLKYAHRAKQIKTKLVKNSVNVEHHISKYVEIVQDLRNEVQFLKSKLALQQQQQQQQQPSLNATRASYPVTAATQKPQSAPSSQQLATTTSVTPNPEIARWVEEAVALHEGQGELSKLRYAELLAKAQANAELQRLQDEITLWEHFHTRSREMQPSQPQPQPAVIAQMRLSVASLQQQVAAHAKRLAELDDSVGRKERALQLAKGRLEQRIADPEARKDLENRWRGLAAALARTEMEGELKLQAHAGRIAARQRDQAHAAIARLSRVVAAQHHVLQGNDLVTPDLESCYLHATYYLPYQSVHQPSAHGGEVVGTESPAPEPDLLTFVPPFAPGLDISARARSASPQGAAPATASSSKTQQHPPRPRASLKPLSQLQQQQQQQQQPQAVARVGIASTPLAGRTAPAAPTSTTIFDTSSALSPIALAKDRRRSSSSILYRNGAIDSKRDSSGLKSLLDDEEQEGEDVEEAEENAAAIADAPAPVAAASPVGSVCAAELPSSDLIFDMEESKINLEEELVVVNKDKEEDSPIVLLDSPRLADNNNDNKRLTVSPSAPSAPSSSGHQAPASGIPSREVSVEEILASIGPESQKREVERERRVGEVRNRILRFLKSTKDGEEGAAPPAAPAPDAPTEALLMQAPPATPRRTETQAPPKTPMSATRTVLQAKDVLKDFYSQQQQQQQQQPKENNSNLATQSPRSTAAVGHVVPPPNFSPKSTRLPDPPAPLARRSPFNRLK
jgi:hypothetical protein